MTDAQMDAVKIDDYKERVGEIFKIGNYVVVPVKDIDTIASIIQTTGKAVMVWFYFENVEWTTYPTVLNPDLDLHGSFTSRHSVTAVDYTLFRGKKCLIIEDSWGTQYGQAGQRIIDEEFFKTRNWFAAYPMNFVFDAQVEEQALSNKPRYRWNKTLAFSPTFFTDPDVVALQNVLKYEGLFPSNTASTGYYGSITAKAVLAWQKAHKVAPLSELEQLAGRVVGVRTLAKLNELYGA
jgi:hypothetical protein